MQVTICEKGCGRTSLDPEANIEKLSIRSRVNGNEEASFDGSLEACKQCRADIHEQLQALTNIGKLTVVVERNTEGR